MRRKPAPMMKTRGRMSLIRKLEIRIAEKREAVRRLRLSEDRMLFSREYIDLIRDLRRLRIRLRAERTKKPFSKNK